MAIVLAALFFGACDAEEGPDYSVEGSNEFQTSCLETYMCHQGECEDELAAALDYVRINGENDTELEEQYWSCVETCSHDKPVFQNNSDDWAPLGTFKYPHGQSNGANLAKCEFVATGDYEWLTGDVEDFEEVCGTQRAVCLDAAPR